MYSRQELFLGKKAQVKINKSKIAIIGIGALGTIAVELLARAGIGELILIDRDCIEISNLHRQTLFTHVDISKPKVIAAKEALSKINPNIKISAHFTSLDNENIGLVKPDIILDCTDNLETRFLINDYSKKNNIPFIYASAIKDKGYIYNILPEKPCLKCILKESITNETCETAGVLNTITSIVASLQVNDATKILLDKNPEKD
mgnify:FL=1